MEFQNRIKNKKLIIFDLDDTLMDTSDLYWRAKNRFIKLLNDYNIDSEQADLTFERIDHENFHLLGHSPVRYRKSMLDTYAYYVEKGVLESDNLLENKIYDCGEMIRNIVPKLIDHAKESLAWCKGYFELALATRGVKYLQKKKIRHYNLDKFFSKVEIVETKNKEFYYNLINESGYYPENVWIIGDSIKSEINPGLSIGANCILYKYFHPDYHWVQEHSSEPLSHDFYAINSLSEIKEILSKEIGDEIKEPVVEDLTRND